jgi:TFIIF-interacting CTD phosphatase-like protein
VQIFISMRPGLKAFLRELKKHFELILFTSSSRIYCDGILRNVIENDGETFFEHKLFKNHLMPPKVFNL